MSSTDDATSLPTLPALVKDTATQGEPRPLVSGSTTAGMSATGAVINMLKLMLGAGVLAMASAFSKAGFWAAIILYPILGVLCWFTMLLLLDAKNAAIGQITVASADDSAAERKRRLEGVKTYRGVGEYAFGAVGRWMVLVAVVLLQLCFCSGYIIIVCNTFGEYVPAIPRWVVAICIVFPVASVLAMIRWIRNLTIVSAFGTTVYGLGVIGVTLGYAAPIVARGAPDPTVSVIWSTMPLFCGTALYSLEGINGVLPIETAMKKPSQASLAMLISVMLYATVVAFFAATAYVAGFARVDVVTLAMPRGIIRGVVQWALVVALVATHPLQLFPATELIEEQLFPGDKSTPLKRVSLRTLLVLSTCLLGGFLRTFSAFSDLVGSLFISFSGFIVPPILFLRIIGLTRGRVHATLAAVVGVGGVVFMVYGTYSAVWEIIDSF